MASYFKEEGEEAFSMVSVMRYHDASRKNALAG